MTTQEEELDRALSLAVLCRTLRLGFQPPTAETRRQISCNEGRQALKDAAAVLAGKQSDELLEAATRFAALSATSLADLERTYTRLVGHTIRGGLSPYETEYGEEALFLQAQELADISGYFLAFGLQPRDKAGERVDHIAVELEFLEFLAKKEAWSLETADMAMLETTRRAYRKFIREHLSRFGRAVAVKLTRAEPAGFYGALGRLCEAFLTCECRRLSLTVGPEFLALRPFSVDDAPMACGSESQLVEIE